MPRGILAFVRGEKQEKRRTTERRTETTIATMKEDENNVMFLYHTIYRLPAWRTSIRLRRPAGCNEESPSVARGSAYFREKSLSLPPPLCPLVWPYVSLKRVVSCPRREPRLVSHLCLFLSTFFLSVFISVSLSRYSVSPHLLFPSSFVFCFRSIYFSSLFISHFLSSSGCESSINTKNRDRKCYPCKTEQLILGYRTRVFLRERVHLTSR